MKHSVCLRVTGGVRISRFLSPPAPPAPLFLTAPHLEGCTSSSMLISNFSAAISPFQSKLSNAITQVIR